MNKLLRMLPIVVLSLSLASCGLIANPSSQENSSNQSFDEDTFFQITGLEFFASAKGSDDANSTKDYVISYASIDGVDIPKDNDADCFKNAAMKISLDGNTESETDDFSTTIYVDYSKANLSYDLLSIAYNQKGDLKKQCLESFDSSLEGIPASAVSCQIKNTYSSGKVMTYKATVNFVEIGELVSLDVLEFNDDNTLNKKTILTSDTLVTDFALQTSAAYTLVRSHYQTATDTYTKTETVTITNGVSCLYQPMFSSDLGIVECPPITFHY